jgi:hypothetical protein
MYPNWDFWFENKPSGNPDVDVSKEIRIVFMSKDLRKSIDRRAAFFSRPGK